jgi:hypothetical protein
MFDISDTLIFLTVVGLRLLIPLAIPRYPLPGIIAAAAIDGVDLGIFTGLTNLDTTNYQSYDKALDVYYLTIAYLSTMRNWTNVEAFRIARVLLYIRLTGSLLFELTEQRYMLLIFPNTFEYFFVLYHLIALRWDPERLARRDIFVAVAFIWVVIKMPQEYWLHVAQRDTTDLLLAYPILIVLLVIIGMLLILGVRWTMHHRLPPADFGLRFAALNPMENPAYAEKERSMLTGGIIQREVFEKVVLITLVSIIFSQILPNVTATPTQLALAVSTLVVTNTLVSEWLHGRGNSWRSTMQQFVVTSVMNIGLSFTFLYILPPEMSTAALQSTLFYLLLITLIITYYDRYRPSYLVHSDEAEQEAAARGG